MGCDDDARDESVKVNRKARFGKQAKRPVHTTLPTLREFALNTVQQKQSVLALRQNTLPGTLEHRDLRFVLHSQTFVVRLLSDS